MGRLSFLILFAALTGCAPTAPGVIGDIQRTARGVGYVAEDIGRSAERARDGVRRTTGAVTNGRLYVPIENWHQTACEVRAYSRGQIVGGIDISPDSFDQLAIGENLVDGSSEVTVTSNCGGIRTVDRVEVDFRRRWFRVNGGRGEHELLILKPEGRQSRQRVNERHERYAQPESARVEPTVIRHRQSSALRACNALPEPRRSDCVRANS